MLIDDIIRAELVSARDVDFAVVANRVAMKVPDEAIREVLASVLREYVRLTASRDRMKVREVGSVEVRSPGRSRWSRHLTLLDTIESIPGGGQKRLRECTAEDLDALAADREERAARTLAVASQYRAFAEQVRAAGVACLGDVPDLNDLRVAA